MHQQASVTLTQVTLTQNRSDLMHTPNPDPAHAPPEIPLTPTTEPDIAPSPRPGPEISPPPPEPAIPAWPQEPDIVPDPALPEISPPDDPASSSEVD